MKKPKLLIQTAVICLAVILTMMLPGPGQAAPSARTIIANTFTLESGETLNEDLTILAGTVILEKGSTVIGNINLTGGTLDVAGQVDGDINATGGTLSLRKTAQITGDITLTGVAYNRADGAEVNGAVSQYQGGLPGLPGVNPGHGLSSIWTVIWFLARVFIFSALAVLFAMFFPRQLERTSQAIVSQPLAAGGLGLMTVIVAPFVILLLAITILLIPIALVLVAILGLISLYGWISLGLETGRRLAAVFHQEWAPPLSAGLGTLMLTFVLFSINFLPCIGWVFPFAAGVVGLGAAILTVMGIRSYPESPAVFRPASTSSVVDAAFNSDQEPG